MSNLPTAPQPAANTLLAEIDIPTLSGSVTVIAADDRQFHTPLLEGSAAGVIVDFSVGDNIIMLAALHPDTYETYRPSGVKVRVYRGHDDTHLGTLLWDTTFDLPTGALAIGDSLSDEKDYTRVELGQRGETPIKFFASNTIPELEYDDVISDITILVE